MDGFKDKVAIVTGGASGIGEALVEQLSRDGAIVIVADINADGARNVAEAMNKSGGKAIAAAVDVANADDVQRLVEHTVRNNGRLDYIFNNAGIAVIGEVRDLDLENWRRIVDVNLWGVIYGSTCAYSVMVKQGFGHIVNTASMAGLIGFPTGASYATTKYGVVGLSTSLRHEGAGLGVKVSAICPGLIQTGIYTAATYINVKGDELLAKLPLKPTAAPSAARAILKGVRRNKAIITVPSSAHFIWWLSRLSPALIAPLHSKMVRDFRKIRKS